MANEHERAYWKYIIETEDGKEAFVFDKENPETYKLLKSFVASIEEKCSTSLIDSGMMDYYTLKLNLDKEDDQ